MSFDTGDLKKPEFRELNPRQRVPVIVDDGFTLYESATIVEYLEDNWPGEPRLFSVDSRRRALQRRMVQEADLYFAGPLERLVDAAWHTPREHRLKDHIAAAYAEIGKELSVWETTIAGDYLSGALSAVDFTLYPGVALALRISKRTPDLLPAELIGPKMTTWVRRMDELPCVRKTWPPLWK